MKLTLAERLLSLGYLPVKEDYKSLKELRRAKECLSWTAEEAAEANKHVQDSPGGKIYDSTYLESVVIDVPISEWATDVIREGLREKNKKRDLMEKELSLYEKFIVDYDQI